MTVLALDPGPEKSALLEWDGHAVVMATIEANAALLERLESVTPSARIPLVVELVESYGMAVGKETFETVFWSGRFAQVFGFEDVCRMGRKEVKIHLCGSSRATDSNIRTALIDRFGGTDKAIGKKKKPGPLYEVKSHLWAALALAITWSDKYGNLQAVPSAVASSAELEPISW